MVNTEALDHTHRDFPRLVPPRRDPVRGRHPPRGGPFFFLPRCLPRATDRVQVGKDLELLVLGEVSASNIGLSNNRRAVG
jgi:hypothetical protein